MNWLHIQFCGYDRQELVNVNRYKYILIYNNDISIMKKNKLNSSVHSNSDSEL